MATWWRKSTSFIRTRTGFQPASRPSTPLLPAVTGSNIDFKMPVTALSLQMWQCGGSGRAQAPKRGIGNQLPSPPARRATNAAPAVSRSLGYRFSLGEISLGEISLGEISLGEETACVVGTAASIRLESVAEGWGGYTLGEAPSTCRRHITAG